LTTDNNFYDLLIQSTDQGFALLEKVHYSGSQASDFRYLKVNPAFERHSGLENVTGKTIREILPVVKPEVIECYDYVVDTGQKLTFEQYVAELDTWYSAEVLPTAINGMIAVLFTNITERKRIEDKLREREERHHFLLKLSDALRTVADPVEVQRLAAQLLGEHLGANQVHYGETVGEVVVINQGWGNGLPPMIGTFAQEDFGKRLHEGYRMGITQVSDDIFTDPNITDAERKTISGAGFNAYVAVPLIKSGKWLSTLAVHSIAPRIWKKSEIELVENTAERTWAAVERAGAEKALHEKERLMSVIFETLPIGVGLLDSEGVLSMSNKEMRRFLPDGRMPSAHETNYKQWLGWDQEGNPLERQNFPGARALRGEKVFPGIEMLYVPLEGLRVWTQVAAVPVKDESGRMLGQVTVVTDIDSIKRTTEALTRTELQFKTFVDASSDLPYECRLADHAYPER